VSVAPKYQIKFNAALDECTKGQSGPFGVAVSGGSDSMALLVLANAWAIENGHVLYVVTVDHQLRPDARVEAETVGDFCSTLGLPHQVLTWNGWVGRGNKAELARNARYDLMQVWAKSLRLNGLFLGHTEDDQAETLLMSIARKSGVDGLSAMRARRAHGDLVLMRPLLGFARGDLRQILTEGDISWADDPSNDDITSERIKMRHLLTDMAASGIDRSALAQVALNLQSAQSALAVVAHDAAKKMATFVGGEIHVATSAFFALPDETRFRILAHSLTWLASAQNRPRQKALLQVMDAIGLGKIATLHGCIVYPRNEHFVIAREPSALDVCDTNPEMHFDGRWRLEGPIKQGQTLSCLGESGLAACRDWRESGMSRFGAMASPAIWENAQLIAAPMVLHCPEWQLIALKDDENYFSTLLGH